MVFLRRYLQASLVGGIYVSVGNFYNLQKRTCVDLKTSLAIAIYALSKGFIYGIAWPILPIAIAQRNDQIMGTDVSLTVENNRLTLLEKV